jgi:hypothetical protein
MTGRPGAEEALKAFFDEAEASFAEAAERSDKIAEHHLRVAGRGACLRFAGAALADALMPALRHLETSPATPSLTTLVWDLRSTGVVLRPPPWEAVPYFERANMRGFRDDRFVLVYDRPTRAFSAVDNVEGRAVHWLADAGSVSYPERATPLRHLLQGWLQREGLFAAHASAVGRASGGVLMSGRSGSGKSTTAALCWRAGLGYLGDDNVMVSTRGELRAYNLYGVTRLDRRALAWFPELGPAVSNPERPATEKAQIRLGEVDPSRVLREFPIRALLLPRVVDACATRLRPVSASSAFRALILDTLFTVLGNPALTTHGLRRVADTVPCYELALGRDLDRIPDVVAGLLSGA